MQPLNRNDVKDWDIEDELFKYQPDTEGNKNTKRRIKSKHKKKLAREIKDAIDEYYEEDDIS